MTGFLLIFGEYKVRKYHGLATLVNIPTEKQTINNYSMSARWIRDGR